MLALLVRKHAAPTGTDVALLPSAAASSRDEWFGIYQGERKVGYARRAVVATGEGYDVRDDSTLALALLGVPQRVTTSLAAETDAQFGLRAFHFALVSPAATFTASGTSDGHHLEVRYGTGDRQDTLAIPLAEPIHLATTFRPRIAAARPAPGTRFTHAVFSPLTLRSEPVTTVVEGRETVDGVAARGGSVPEAVAVHRIRRPGDRRARAGDRRRRTRRRTARRTSSPLGRDEHDEGAERDRPERAGGAPRAPWGLQRARGAPDRARPRRGHPGAHGRRRRLPRRCVPLPCLERALARPLGERRRRVRADAGRRHAREAPRRRPGTPFGSRGARGWARFRDAGGRRVIRLERLTKRYGTLVAVDDLSLEVESGCVFGFLGRNAAGKTTTIRMMMGLLEPTAGTAVLGGHDIRRAPEAAKAVTGYLPDHLFLYDKLTALEFLRFAGGLYGLRRADVGQRAQALLEQFGLTRTADELTETLSQGMRQRLALAAALVHRPRVLVRGEPMVGLDPEGALELRRLVRSLAADGVTVLLSTHSLAVAEELCGRIGIIDRGRLVAVGTLADLRARARPDDGAASLETVFFDVLG